MKKAVMCGHQPVGSAGLIMQVVQTIVSLSVLFACPACTVRSSELEAEAELEVYQVLLEALYPAAEQPESLVVMDQTRLNAMPDDSPRRMLQYLRENLGKAVDPATLNDFRSKNKQPQSLTGKLAFEIPVTYLSLEDREALFSQGDGWERFYAAYPGSSGVLTLSRVGFNAAMDQAIVYVGLSGGPMEGVGYYVFLTREGDDWQIQDRVVAWIV